MGKQFEAAKMRIKQLKKKEKMLSENLDSLKIDEQFLYSRICMTKISWFEKTFKTEDYQVKTKSISEFNKALFECRQELTETKAELIDTAEERIMLQNKWYGAATGDMFDVETFEKMITASKRWKL